MIEISERGGEIWFSVRVQPRASRTAIAGMRDGALLVRVTAPPVEGQANDALVRLLSARLNVPRSAVRIVAGERGRVKRVAVRGASSEAVRMLAAGEDC